MPVDIAGFDLSWIAQIASLIVLPFAHEDLAIVAGAYVIAHKLMPTGLVAGSLYGGMVASDLAIYGVGFCARKIPWLNRLTVDDKVRAFADRLTRNMYGLAFLCRVVPGVIFVAYVACGWTRVPLARFTIANLIVSALYLPLMLIAIIAFGDAVGDHMGLWVWPVALGLIGLAGFARRRLFAFGLGPDVPETTAGSPSVSRPNVDAAAFAGMPEVSDISGKIAPAEYIPPVLFYAPLALTWLARGARHGSLTLPSAANPAIVTGGMWGESKSDYFRQVGADQQRWLADGVTLRRSAEGGDDVALAFALMEERGLSFPIVAKPDIGWHGYGVRLIATEAELIDYIAKFPRDVALILQRYVADPGEAAVLYARLPGEASGRVVSLTLRYFPHVIGDGQTRVRDLIGRDPRSAWKSRLHLGSDPQHCSLYPRELDRVPARGEVVRLALIGNQRAGGLYRDATSAITPELAARFDAIARSMPEFHYGRFDIRFRSLEDLQRGEGFAIVEINGIGGEAIDVWDPALPIRDAYRRLFAHQRLLFAIGARNRVRGFAPCGTVAFIRHLVHQTRLIPRYPASA